MISQSQLSQRQLSQKFISEQRAKNLKGVENNVFFWLNADNVVTDSNGYISQAIDLSGNNNSPIQSVQNNKPLLVQNAINGHPTIQFNGAQSLKKQFSSFIPQPITIFAVWKISTANPVQICFGNYTASNFHLSYGDGGITPNGGAWFTYTKPATFNYILNSIVFNTTNGGIYENGILKASGNIGTNGMGGISIGTYYDNSYGLFGDIAEILGVINCTDIFRVNIEQILKEKYALV